MSYLGPAVNESDAAYFIAESNATYLTQSEAQVLEYLLDNATHQISKTIDRNGYFAWAMDMFSHDENAIGDMWEVFYHITNRDYMNGSAVQLDPTNI